MCISGDALPAGVRRLPRPRWRNMLLGGLIGLPLPLSSPPATQSSPAQSSSPSAAPALSVSLGSLDSALPGVNLPVPGVGASLPGVNVTLPSVNVTLPSVSVSAPGVSVTTPSVSVSTPSVSVTTPSVSTSPSGSSGTGSSESPASGSAPTGGEAGAGGAPKGGGATGGATSGQGASAATEGVTVRYAPAAGTSAAAEGSRAPVVTHGGGQPAQQVKQVRAGAKRRTPVAHAGRPRSPNGARISAAARGKDRSALAASAPPAPARDARSVPHGSGGPLGAIGEHIPLPIPVPDWSKPIILALLALALWFGVRSRMHSRRARRLERQHATLMHDAGAMQAALVPKVPARVGGLAVSVAYRPADGPAAGGDFYDVFVPERGKVAVILGDVVGHGHAALKQAALTRYTLRAYVQTGMQPRATLALAGRVLADPSAEHLATVVVGIYDTREGCLTYASAGHPPPILHGLRTREPLKVCASPPLGWILPTGLRQTTVSLPAGAVVCFFSDGLLDERVHEDALGRERLSEMLGEVGSRPNAARLLARVRAASLATPDDMAACILTSEVALVGAGVHTEELEVDAGALDGGQARFFLETCQLPRLELEQMLYRATDMVAELGTALLRVELAGRTPCATVLAPPPAPQAPAGRGSALVGAPTPV